MSRVSQIPALICMPYPQASFVLDFASNYYRGSGAQGSSPSALPGYNFTRALAAYAEDTAGNLIQFASGVPRITNKGVLIEESRTNLLLRSQEFDAASWSKTSATATANQATAPDGTTTGGLLTPSASTAARAMQTVTTVGSTAYNFSVFIKQGTSTQSRLLVRDETSGVNFLQTTAITWTGGVPSIGGTTGSWLSPVPFANGWWRISGTASTGVGGVSVSVQVFPDNLDGTGSLYIWGAQLELGSFPTSYIPTTSASVTRPADVFYYTLASDFTAADFTWAWQIGGFALEPGKFPAVVAVNDGSSSNQFQAYINGTDARAYDLLTTSGVNRFEMHTGTASSGSLIKATNKTSTSRASAAGASAALNGSWTAFSPTTLRLAGKGPAGATDANLNAYLQRLAIYPFAASDAQLQSISSGNF